MSRDEMLENAVVDSQKILAEWILPDSKTTDKECLSKLLGVLDNKKLVESQRSEREYECEEDGDCVKCKERGCQFHK